MAPYVPSRKPIGQRRIFVAVDPSTRKTGGSLLNLALKAKRTLMKARWEDLPIVLQNELKSLAGDAIDKLAAQKAGSQLMPLILKIAEFAKRHQSNN